VQFQPGTDGAFLRRTRIRFNSYFCLESVTGKGSRGRNTAWPTSVGTAVKMAGQNIFITDNDIYSSGDVVSTLNNGAAGASYLHIARNQLWNGGTTHWGISWKQSIYEDNVAIGSSTTAMGSNCEPSQPASQFAIVLLPELPCLNPDGRDRAASAP
jgi:hypothetical protein